MADAWWLQKQETHVFQSKEVDQGVELQQEGLILPEMVH